MSTFDETLHPRGQAANAGQFAAKRNTAPTAQLMDDLMGPDTIVGNYVNERIAGEASVEEIAAEDFRGGDVVDASELKVGDVLIWRSMTDDGERYFAEQITHVQPGIDERYRRVVDVETARRPGGDSTIRFRASQSVGLRAAAEVPPVVYPVLRDGHTPERLVVVVESSDDWGSTIVLRAAGTNAAPMLDRFRITERLQPGEMPLLEASHDVQSTVASRFIPLAGMSLDETLRREPIGHRGRAWND